MIIISETVDKDSAEKIGAIMGKYKHGENAWKFYYYEGLKSFYVDKQTWDFDKGYWCETVEDIEKFMEEYYEWRD
jgi:hypothetical protein